MGPLDYVKEFGFTLMSMRSCWTVFSKEMVQSGSQFRMTTLAVCEDWTGE